MKKKKATQKMKKVQKKAAKQPLDTGRKYELLGIVFFTVGIISLIGLLGLNVGFVGFYFAKVLAYMFGIGAYIVPLFIMTATGEIKIRKKRIIEFFLDPFRQYKSEALRER